MRQAESQRATTFIVCMTVWVAAGLTGCSAWAEQVASPDALSTVVAAVHAFDITAAIKASLVLVVFFNVLLQQFGVPVPAVPTLLIAGSVAASPAQLALLLATAVLASLCSDAVWYAAGRAFGYRVLAGLCKLSLNPGSCVSTAEGLFLWWGAWSLIGAKLVPGFSIVGPPIAGSLKLPLPSFFAASTIGAGLWAGTPLVVGWVWRAQVQQLIEAVARNSAGAVGVLLGALVIWLGWIVWRKRRFQRAAAIRHVSSAELMLAMASSAPVLLLDLRGAVRIAELGSIDGATPALLNDLPSALGHWKPDDLIVTLCACPKDAAAIQAAHVLKRMGFTHVHPLRGGYESWMRYLREVAAQGQVALRAH